MRFRIVISLSQIMRQSLLNYSIAAKDTKFPVSGVSDSKLRRSIRLLSVWIHLSAVFLHKSADMPHLADSSLPISAQQINLKQ
jgi:hypothetical protein